MLAQTKRKLSDDEFKNNSLIRNKQSQQCYLCLKKNDHVKPKSL